MSTSAFDPPRAPATPDAPGAPPKPKIVRRLEAQRTRHRLRPKPVRALTVLAGFAVVALGILALPLPGPGWVIIFIGLGLLSLEFRWAGKALDRALIEANKAQKRAANASTGQKIATVVFVALILAGLGVWAWLGDIPLVPEPGRG